ncbi:hypothetical protein RND81_14G221100 [Saponaria officinalis]|uniref:Bromo domain-containing protein n=1 Tax=Saponaria officinalis TaxID=3572 RepID=A0AAW1GV23_SAPOF
MRKLVEKKKKKGRPSLLDLQKRSLKLQNKLLNNHQINLTKNNNITNIKISNNNKNNKNIDSNNNIDNNNFTPKSTSSNPNRRSTRRNPKLASDDDGESGGEDALDDAEEGEEFRSADFAPGEDEDEKKSSRKRKIESISLGSGVDVAEIDDNVEKQRIAVTNLTNSEQGPNEQDDRASTSLPDKKLLLFILDTLRKKDTYGVFAEPVDPEEIPDYHEVIKHPMDFSTVQKKLEDSAYGNLEQFEKDIFLICSNGMQYNAPDTIYFRQARSMHELATKNFENLRQDSDGDELEPESLEPESKVVRRGRPPKHLKRGRGRPPLERSKSDFSEATPSTVGGFTNRLKEHTTDPPRLEKYGSTDSFARTVRKSRNSEPYVGWSAEKSERSDYVLGSTSKGYSMKHGKKQIVLDDSRRNTYLNSDELSRRCEPSVLTTFLGERKQLVAVGFHTKYGYARSLARFAAKLGPVAWNVASKKIEKCLPSDIKFGRGWVGENNAPSERLRQQSPDASVQSSSGDRSEHKLHTEQASKMHMPGHLPQLNNKQNTSVTDPDNNRDSISVSSPSMLSCAMASVEQVQIHHAAAVESRDNCVNGSGGLKIASEIGKMIESRKTHLPSDGCEEHKLSANSSEIKNGDILPKAEPNQKVGSDPPDLNVSFRSLVSSHASVKTDSVRPDLALQL